MAFVICVCADLYESKVNLEIPFAARPSMAELNSRLREIFDYEANAMKPPSVAPRPFTISRILCYNDATENWDDFHKAEQLVPGCQLYCYQPNANDVQADLPKARAPKHPSVSGGYSHAPPMGAAHGQSGHAYPQGEPSLRERAHVPQEEKVRIVFGELDTNTKQFLDYGDLERGFKQRGLHFAVNTIGELFHKADVNKDGRIVFDEWLTWCTVYPNTLDAMYYRGRDTGEEAQIRNQMRDLNDANDADRLAAELLNDLLKRSSSPAQLGNATKTLNRFIGSAAQKLHADPSRDLRPDIQRDLEDLTREAAGRERQMPELESQLRAAQERRAVLQSQEMNLLEHEIRLERQRDAMRAQEQRYQEAEHLFNTKAHETGSPRRAQRMISPSVQ